MTNVLNFYDEIDETTGKRKYTWKSLQHGLRQVSHIRYLARFRKYIENHGTKKQKVDDIETFAYEKFEAARGNCLSVHDLDPKRWALQRARAQSLHDFTASKLYFDMPTIALFSINCLLP